MRVPVRAKEKNEERSESMKEFGLRLVRARKMVGMSLRELAERLERKVSSSALCKYERGQMMPGSEVLRMLCEALGVGEDYLLSTRKVQIKAVEFRKTSRLGIKAIERIYELAMDQLERISEVEELLGDERMGFENPLSGMLLRNEEDVEEAAECLRKEWGLGQEPIAHVIALLESHGVCVVEVSAPDSFSGFSGWSDAMPVVVLNKKMPPDRKRLTALHELCHLMLKMSDDIPGKEKEKLCHRFAAAVLAPREALVARLGPPRRLHLPLGELLALKGHFGISCAALFYRLRDAGIINSSTLERLQMEWSKRGFRKSEPGSDRICQETTTRLAALTHKALSLGLIDAGRAAYLTGLSREDCETI